MNFVIPECSNRCIARAPISFAYQLLKDSAAALHARFGWNPLPSWKNAKSIYQQALHSAYEESKGGYLINDGPFWRGEFCDPSGPMSFPRIVDYSSRSDSVESFLSK